MVVAFETDVDVQLYCFALFFPSVLLNQCKSYLYLAKSRRSTSQDSWMQFVIHYFCHNTV